MTCTIYSDNFSAMLENYPEFITRSDLVALGLFCHTDAIIQCHRKGKGPRYVKVGKKVLYAKRDILDWLRSNLKGTPC